MLCVERACSKGTGPKVLSLVSVIMWLSLQICVKSMVRLLDCNTGKYWEMSHFKEATMASIYVDTLGRVTTAISFQRVVLRCLLQSFECSSILVTRANRLPQVTDPDNIGIRNSTGTRRRYVVKHNLITEVYLMTVTTWWWPTQAETCSSFHHSH